jgi:cobalt/nickel transport system permease protein
VSLVADFRGMSKIADNLLDIGYIDTLSCADSPLHRLDPRSKLITTLIFIIAVVSFDKYTLSGLIPFFIFPITLVALSGLPAGYLFKKVLLVLPFAALIAIFNPLMDREVIVYVGPLGISGGWISFFSIIMRFLLTVSAALILIALTGFNSVCLALSKFGVPKPFVVQLLFFFRYLFVLTDEAGRMVRAWSLRAFSSKKISFGVFISLIGHLLLRTLDRAERIYLAMCSRGFDGRVRMLRIMKIGPREIIFGMGWSILFVLLRWYNIPVKLGGLIIGRS